MGSAAAPASGPEPGAQMLAEIHEQPAVLARLVEHAPAYEAVAREIRRRGLSTIRMVGHGSSDNAASYGVYAFGLLPGWTALRDSISLSVYYGAAVDVTGSCVLALSQSGRTPDVVEYVQRARERGAYTVAVTNDASSALGTAAEAVLPLAAGVEHAVAATKTYTAQVAAIALLAAQAAGSGDAMAAHLKAAARVLAAYLPELERRVPELAVSLAYTGRMFVIGRGPEFATAREMSLKLMETCRIAAEPLTATDLVHGPVAALDGLFPVWTIASEDPGLPAVLGAAARAREAGATIYASGTAADAVAGAAYRLPVPRAPTMLLSPLLSVAPAQMLAWALARAKGFDPDRPLGLSKVTLAL